MNLKRRPLRVSLVVFPQADPSILYGVYDTLWAAGWFWDTLQGKPPGASIFEPHIVSAAAGPLRLVTGVSIVVQDSIDDVEKTDIVFVPNVIAKSGDDLRALDRRILAWIRRQYEAGADVYSACGGSLAIAEAGLLDGLDATTHWGYANLFRQEYPNVTLHPERVLVQTGRGHRIVSCGGASSWQDLVLYLVTKRVGSEEAIRLSKIFLYQWHHDGQLPYACMVQNVVHDDPLIRELQTWIAKNYHRNNLVAQLTRRSGLPERTFARRFKQATGYTPLAYIQALRIEEAKQLLETGGLAVDRVGREVGYEDTAHFRRLFVRLAGLTPAAYRRMFRIPRHVRRIAA
jgi:transcriptional regulator GlxA family with amidase domain